jgi:hypothetical protein
MLEVLIIVLCAFAVIGALVGLIRGYLKCSYWGGVALFAMLITRLVIKNIDISENLYWIIVLGIALGSTIVLTLLFQLVKRYISRSVVGSRKYSYYKRYDDEEENKELILTSIDRGDKKAYRKYSKRKFKQSSGPWGVVDRIFGFITGAINGAVAATILITLVLFFVDLSNYAAAIDLFNNVYKAAIWTEYGAVYGIDLIICALMGKCIRSGYKVGISSTVCTLLILALICLAGFLAYHLSFNVEKFTVVAETIASYGMFDGIRDMVDMLLVGRIILTVILFIIFLIIVIIISAFLPGIVERMRSVKAFAVCDGVVGAVVLTGVVFALLIVAGSATYAFHSFDALSTFNKYIDNLNIANCLYGKNPLGELSIIKMLLSK